MKKILFSLLLPFLSFSGISQNSIYKINTQEIKNQLRDVKTEKDFSLLKGQAEIGGMLISLPDPSGKLISFTVIESPVLSENLSLQFPDIKTYRIYGKNDIEGVLTISNEGIHSYYFHPDGNVIINVSNLEQNEYNVIYEDNSQNNINCEVEGFGSFNSDQLRLDAVKSLSNGSTMRTYRLAILTTREFYVNYGSQSAAMSAVTSMVNSIRVLYEKSFSISFELVTTKIFENNNDAPFSPSSSANADYAAIAFYRLSQSDPANFGEDKYDVGHVLHHSTGGGGVAYLSSVCSSTYFDYGSSWGLGLMKGAAHSGISLSYLSSFFHEMVHQLSGHHTFNAQTGSCSGSNYNQLSAFEPGSGNTIMSYWGNCKPENIPGWVDRTYFHSNSLITVSNYITSGSGASCGSTSSTGNTPPNLNLNPGGKSLKIPKGTPFKLEGSGTHPKGYTIKYNWEQYDTGLTRGTAKDAQNSTDSPIFRSVEPSTSGNVRYFPDLSHILNGSIANPGETLPQVARNINMRLTARDDRAGGGTFTTDQLTVQVVDAGPFLITSQNTPSYWIANGTNKVTITWSVNNTDAAPLNVTKVKILLSKDGGNTFPITLANNINNNGTYTVTIPNEPTTKGRIKIEPMGNHIFFDINDVSITISTSCTVVTTNISPTTSVEAEKGTSDLNLNLVSRGSAISSISGQLTTSSSKGNLIVANSSDCYMSNEVNYNTHQFVVGTSGFYTFKGTTWTYGTVMTLFEGDFDPLNMCDNFLYSSGIYISSGNYISLYDELSFSLQPGIYTLVVSGFNQSTPLPVLPVNYTINITGGNTYNLNPPKSSPLAYTYIVKNNSTGKIIAFQDDSDLRNDSKFTPSNYTVYGLAYANWVNLNTYAGGNFTAFQTALSSGAVCGKISSNSVSVNITGDCPETVTLTGLADSGEYLANSSINSNQTINSGKNITYKAGKSITLTPVTNGGFLVAAGAVFKAEIGGCQ